MRSDLKWGNKEIRELWRNAVKKYSPEDKEVSIEPYALTRLIINLLESSGGKIYSGSISDGYAPGFTSVICLLHAKSPKSVFKAALTKLKGQMRKFDHRAVA